MGRQLIKRNVGCIYSFQSVSLIVLKSRFIMSPSNI